MGEWFGDVMKGMRYGFGALLALAMTWAALTSVSWVGRAALVLLQGPPKPPAAAPVPAPPPEPPVEPFREQLFPAPAP